jgi:signal transduction histidine kinase
VCAWTVGLCAAIALAIATLHIAHDAPGFSLALTVPHGTLLLLVGGWSLAVAGALFGFLRGGGRLELILGATSCAWLLAEWDNPAASTVVFSTGLALSASAPAVLTHLALAYPSGRLRNWVDRGLVAAGYLSLIAIVGIAPAIFYNPETQGCIGCAHNMWHATDDPEAFAAISRAGVRVSLVWSVAALGLVALRLVLASPARRRAVAWVVLPALCYLAAVIAEYGRRVGRGFLGADSADARLWRLQAIALTGTAVGVVAGALRGRIAHRSLTRLVVDLGRAADSHELRASLAERLRDPSLRLAYPLGDGRYVDRDGTPVQVSERAATPLHFADTELAVVLHRPGLLDSPELIGETIGATRLALENERLRAQSLAQLADLRASGTRIVDAADKERRRLERDLHDGAQQHLVGLLMALRLARVSGTGNDARLAAAQDQLERTIAALRELAHGLYPVLLEDAGLGPALTALSETRHLRITAVPAERLPHVVETTAYRLIEKCSRAGRTTMHASVEDASLIVALHTDGHPSELDETAARVETLSGTLDLNEAEGTSTIRLLLPIRNSSSTAD